jgi:hypothetical protein
MVGLGSGMAPLEEKSNDILAQIAEPPACTLD